jgi:hypothetical protein
MLFIYFLSDGEIYQASMPEKDLAEFFGESRAKEMSKVFGSIYMEYNNFIFYNFKEFHVIDGQIKMKDDSVLQNIK